MAAMPDAGDKFDQLLELMREQVRESHLTRIELRGEMRELRTDLHAEMDGLRTELRGEMQQVRTDLGERIDALAGWVKVLHNNHIELLKRFDAFLTGAAHELRVEVQALRQELAQVHAGERDLSERVARLERRSA